MKNEFDPKAVSFEKIYEEMSHPDRTEIPEMNTVSEARLVYQNLLAAQMELSMKNEELLKTQKELEVSRTRYFALYDFAPLGYVTLNENGFIIEVNFTAATMLGTSKEALISQSFSDVILPEDKILYNYHLKVRSQKNAPQVYTLRLLRRNGAPFWAMVEGPNVYSTKESPVFHLIIRDITRQKNIEELHRENEENDKAPGKDHFALVVRIGADGHFISVNEKYCSLFGKTEAELIGTDITPQVHKEDVAKSRNAWLDLFRSPYSCYFEQRTMTVMGWRWIAWTDNSVLNDRGEVVAIIGVGHDITEQVMIENALRDRNKELECMFALASLFKSNEFSFDEVMNRAVQIIHHSLQFTEHTAVSLTLGDKTFLTADFMESPHMLTQEIVVSGIPSGYLQASFPGEKLPPAREFFLQEQLQFLGEVAKQLSLYVEHDNLKRDLTREKKIVAASDRLKTTFLNNISHEVRSPLNGIIGFGNLLAQTDISQEEKERYTPLLTTSSNRLLSLITDYMDMSLISSGGIVTSYQEVNVKTLLTGLKKRFQYLCDEKKISFKLMLPEKAQEPVIWTDLDLFQKIISHLLDNGIKFTENGEVAIGYSVLPDKIVFFVKDTGIGISESALERIFEPFMQEDMLTARGYEGSGLGLPIAMGLSKLLGGEIQFDSVMNEGTTAFFSLPLRKGPHDSTDLKEGPATKNPMATLPVLLIAEDELINRAFLETTLRKSSSAIFVASNGEEAVEMCHVHPEISVVLMDIKMPKMDGITATKLIREFRPDLPVIAVTAFAMSGDKKQILDSGFTDYLAKPVLQEELLQMLEKYS